MKKIHLNIKSSFNNNKSIYLFLVIIFVIAVITGSIFYLTLNANDNKIVVSFINEYVSNIKNGVFTFNKDYISYILSNSLIYLIIFLLGFSVIGIPIIVFLFFYKCFSLGFSVGAILSIYKYKGLIFSFVYVFPHQVIYILCYMLLIIYAFRVSFLIIKAILKKEDVSFNSISKRFLYMFLICILITFILSLYETFLLPKVIKYILFID